MVVFRVAVVALALGLKCLWDVLNRLARRVSRICRKQSRFEVAKVHLVWWVWGSVAIRMKV